MKKTDVVRLHTVNDQVWYQGIDQEPIHYGPVTEFVEKGIPTPYSRIRMMGMACNAELIVKLYDRGQHVEVCTPLIVERHSDRRKPGPVLFELGLCGWSPSQGGFHKVIESDRAAYALTAALCSPRTEAELLPLLKQHPGWQSLDFLGSVSIPAAATILARMIDPRWFVDACHPDRPNKFYHALGLDPYTQKAITGSKYANSRHVHKQSICRYVLRCWKQENYEHEVKALFELAGPKPRANATQLGIRPQDFCWRVWAGHKHPAKADMRGSQCFADFLRQTWLSEIYRGAASTPEERAGLFRAADFFKYPEEVYAYEQYALRFSSHNQKG